jgi:hypothetical protein
MGPEMDAWRTCAWCNVESARVIDRNERLAMRKKRRLCLLPSVAVLLLLAAVSCSPDSFPQRFVSTVTPLPFQLDQLLLDVSVFPAGWRVSGPPSPALEGRGQVDDLSIEFRCVAGSSHALHDIYRYEDEQAARRRYRRYWDFGSADRITAWKVPSELDYESRVAERFRFACADFRGYPTERFTVCQAMGQYNEFIAVFSVSFVPDNMPACMTWSELQRILKTMDERMMQFVVDSEALHSHQHPAATCAPHLQVTQTFRDN